MQSSALAIMTVVVHCDLSESLASAHGNSGSTLTSLLFSGTPRKPVPSVYCDGLPKYSGTVAKALHITQAYCGPLSTVAQQSADKLRAQTAHLSCVITAWLGSAAERDNCAAAARPLEAAAIDMVWA